LNVGYLKEHIQQQFSEKKFSDVSISFIAEEKPLDTAGAVLHAQKQFRTTFLVLNGDLITNINLSAMLEFHRRTIKEGGIATMFILENQGNGQVEFDENQRKITRFGAS
jgi:NDP-sugar pyrophosphorylase family protein